MWVAYTVGLACGLWFANGLMYASERRWKRMWGSLMIVLALTLGLVVV
jgi:hypothetical protein